LLSYESKKIKCRGKIPDLEWYNYSTNPIWIVIQKLYLIAG